jgi:alkaline phosphatase D
LAAARADGAFVVALGSCNDVNKTNTLWPEITARRPDLWAWLGDNVYADHLPKRLELLRLLWSEPWRLRGGVGALFQQASPEKLVYMYGLQKRLPAYRAFLDSIGGERNMVAIWDDHDVGLNDAGASLGAAYLARSQAAFLDFVGASAEDERQSRPGIYASRDVAGGRVRLIMLDTRQFRSDYGDEKRGDVLGEAQWRWLEQQLAGSAAQFNVLLSGVQVLQEPPLRVKVENWDRLPTARARLLRLLRDTPAQGLVLLSGDVHFSEFSEAHCGRFALPEFTSSGLTHSWMDYPFPLPFAFEAALRVLPLRYALPGSFYLRKSFGELAFAGLGTPGATVTARIVAEGGRVVREHVWSAHGLKPAGAQPHCQWAPSQGPPPGEAEKAALLAVWLVVAAVPLLALASLVALAASRLCARKAARPKGKDKAA